MRLRFVKYLMAFSSNRFISLLLSFALARYFGATSWGEVSSARALIDIPASMIRGGGELLIVREVSKANDPVQAARSVFGAAVQLLLPSVALAVALALVILNDESYLLVLSLTCLALFPTVLIQLEAAREAVDDKLRALLLDGVFSQIAKFLVAIGLGTILIGSAAIASSYLLVSSALAVWLFRRRIFVGLRFSKSVTMQYLRLGGTYLLASLPARLDTFLVAALVGFAAGGAYSIMVAVTSVVTVIGAVQGRILGPIASRSLTTREVKRTCVSICRFQRLAVVFGLPLALLISAIFLELSPLLGNSYFFPISTLVTLSLAYAALAVFNYEGLVLSMTGRESSEALVLGIAGVCFIPGCLMLTGNLQGLGAAFSTLLYSAIVFVGRKISILRLYNINMWRLGARAAIAFALQTFGLFIVHRTDVAGDAVNSTLVAAGVTLVIGLLLCGGSARRLLRRTAVAQ